MSNFIGAIYFNDWDVIFWNVSTVSPGWLNLLSHRTQYLTKLGWATSVVSSIYFVSIYFLYLCNKTIIDEHICVLSILLPNNKLLKHVLIIYLFRDHQYSGCTTNICYWLLWLYITFLFILYPCLSSNILTLKCTASVTSSEVYSNESLLFSR